jgi:hypothetical protein
MLELRVAKDNGAKLSGCLPTFSSGEESRRDPRFAPSRRSIDRVIGSRGRCQSILSCIASRRRKLRRARVSGHVGPDEMGRGHSALRNPKNELRKRAAFHIWPLPRPANQPPEKLVGAFQGRTLASANGASELRCAHYLYPRYWPSARTLRRPTTPGRTK